VREKKWNPGHRVHLNSTCYEYAVMRYEVQSWLWTTRFAEKDLYVFDRTRSMGFEGIEIDLGHPEALPIDAIKRKMRETGMSCTFSLGLRNDQSLISPNPETRKNGIKFLKKLIEIVSEFEAEILCGILYAAWGEFTGKMRTPEEWERSKNGLLDVADLAKDHKVVLALEPVNRFEGCFLNTAEEAVKFVEDVNHPNVQVHLDTFQMNIEENSLYEAIKTAGKHLYHVHLCESHRGIPGRGHIPWRDVFKALKEIGYNRWGVIEAWLPDIFLGEMGEIPRAVAISRSLAPNGDTIAQEGLRFLKQIEGTV